ncbi:MAG: zinc ABC transporter substrate-binding protein [Gammaproteobacteria bacterium]|nr:zinc ABC transporter substrate-binding protein [Gammaproteobacteria bacterium]
MQTRSYTSRLFYALVLMLPLLVHAAPQVMVSIKPVHSLIAGVMAGIGLPELLLRNGRSPHHFSLTASDVRKLTRAERVYWIGEPLELPLAKILRATVSESRVVTLLSLPDLQLLPLREGVQWERHAFHEQGEQHDKPVEKGISPAQVNPHVWLSPINAALIVRMAVEDLSHIDPENSSAYRRNGATLLMRLQELDRQIGEQLAGVRDVPFIVFHDAYAYFEHHYQLNAVGSVTLSPERMPGAQHIQQLRNRIKSLNARCVFSEPQFEPKLVATLLEDTQARAGRLDPLGASLPLGPDAYFTMMSDLAEALAGCLGGDGK